MKEWFPRVANDSADLLLLRKDTGFALITYHSRLLEPRNRSRYKKRKRIGLFLSLFTIYRWYCFIHLHPATPFPKYSQSGYVRFPRRGERADAERHQNLPGRNNGNERPLQEPHQGALSLHNKQRQRGGRKEHQQTRK